MSLIKLDRSLVPLLDMTGSFSGSISVAPPTDESTTLTLVESTTSISVPSGAKEVSIYNAGGLAAADGTVNGQAWSVGRQETFQKRQVGDKVYLLPAFSITCNGSLFQVSYRT